MGVLGRRILPRFLLGLAVGVCAGFPLLAAGPAADPLQTALRDKLFSSLKPEQQKGLTKASPIETMIGRLDLQQRQGAATQLAPLEKQFNDPKSLNEIGAAYLKLGAFADAARVAGEMKAKYPDSALGPFLEAKAKAETGDSAGALEAAKAAAMIDPSNGEVMAYFKLLRNGGQQSTKVPVAEVTPTQPQARANRENPTLGATHTPRVNAALAKLRESVNGKRILIAIVPNSNGSVTEADLREHGVTVTMKAEPLKGRNFGSVEKEGNTYIIVVNAAVLHEANDVREQAAFLGGKLDQVAYDKKAGGGTPPILLEWRDRVARAVILIDLGVEAFATTASSLFSQEVRLDERVLKGNLAGGLNVSRQEDYSDKGNAELGSVADSESRFGNLGLDRILRLLFARDPSNAVAAGRLSADKKKDFANALSADYPTQ